jgi:hypothetical protein
MLVPMQLPEDSIEFWTDHVGRILVGFILECTIDLSFISKGSEQLLKRMLTANRSELDLANITIINAPCDV